MASATSSTLRAGKAKRRKPAVSRNICNAITGVAAAGLTVVATATLSVVLLRPLAVSVEAQSDLRSTGVFADATYWQAWNARPQVGRAAQVAIVASLSLPETRAAAPAPRVAAPAPRIAAPETRVAAAEPMPNAALAFAPPDPAIAQSLAKADPEVTGSLGVFAVQSVPFEPAPAPERAAHVPAPASERIALAPVPRREPTPLPRVRPRLASLTPPDVSVIKPAPDASMVRTAIYDITAGIVYLPNGEKLEAHSGLGAFMDDPRHVHRRMRGATPPNVYRLRMREALFHGVRAIRLLPENEKDMFGRDGILAHTYMLGPSGQSNGCVSFKDYPRFLRAFLRGEIDRMIVVARLDKPPAFYARRDIPVASNAF